MRSAAPCSSASGLALVLAIEAGPNYARFGKPLETGYASGNSVLHANRTTAGTTGILPRHLYVSIFRGWDGSTTPCPETVARQGFSILLTSPILL